VRNYANRYQKKLSSQDVAGRTVFLNQIESLSRLVEHQELTCVIAFAKQFEILRSCHHTFVDANISFLHPNIRKYLLTEMNRIKSMFIEFLRWIKQLKTPNFNRET
jgi:hypothetical protein